MSSTNSEQQFDSILRKFLTQQQSLDDTIDQLTAPIEAAYVNADPLDDGQNSAASLLWLLWQAVIAVAQSLPYDDQDGSQSRLVALFAELKKRPTPQLPADKLERVQNKDPWSLAPIWENLAIWGWQLRESFDILDPLSSGTASADEWVNFNAFLARLTEAKISDQSFFGVVVLQTTLEEQQDSWHAEDIKTKSAAIGAVAVWLLHTSDFWYNHGWQNEQLSRNPRPSWSLWQGTPWTVDQARVRFWAKRLNEVVNETDDLADQWKSLADKAVQKIDSL